MTGTNSPEIRKSPDKLTDLNNIEMFHSHRRSRQQRNRQGKKNLSPGKFLLSL